MGCRGVQSLVVLLSIFNFVSLIGSVVFLFAAAVVSIALRKGSYEVYNIFTYQAYLINKFMVSTDVLGCSVNLHTGVIVGMIVASLAIFTSLFGFILTCCRCRGSPKATKAYNAFVTINVITHLAVIIAAVVMMKNITGKVEPAMQRLQNSISVNVVDDIGSTELNAAGRLFQQIQAQYNCCGVKNSKEWLEVDWFRNKYMFQSMKSSKSLSFPCTPLGYMAPVIFPCGSKPEPDCTTAEPAFDSGCAEPLEFDIRFSLHCFTCPFGFLLVVQILGLILSSIYTHKVARPASPHFEGVRNSASRSSVNSTQALMPYLENTNISSMDPDELAQMCFAIISKDAK